MLNLECQTVYDIIRSIAGTDDVYKIVEADEIIDRMPKEIPLSKVQLSAVIRELKEREYITVKYFTPDEYCLLVTKRIDERTKLQQQADNAQNAKQALSAQESKKKSGEAKAVKTVGKGMVFFMSLLGSILGSGVVATITALVIRFVIMA